MDGDRNDWDVRAARLFLVPNDRGGLKAVHFWHLSIHQDEIEGFHFSLSDAYQSGVGHGDVVAALLQQAHG